MNAARWVLVGILAGGSVAFIIGCAVGVITARRAADRQWRALFVQLGIDHGNEIQEFIDALGKRDQAIVDLQRNIGVVWDAGVYAGQTFQADRQGNGL